MAEQLLATLVGAFRQGEGEDEDEDRDEDEQAEDLDEGLEGEDVTERASSADALVKAVSCGVTKFLLARDVARLARLCRATRDALRAGSFEACVDLGWSTRSSKLVETGLGVVMLETVWRKGLDAWMLQRLPRMQVLRLHQVDLGEFPWDALLSAVPQLESLEINAWGPVSEPQELLEPRLTVTHDRLRKVIDLSRCVQLESITCLEGCTATACGAIFESSTSASSCAN